MLFQIPKEENFKWAPVRKSLAEILADLKAVRAYMEEHAYKNPKLRFALEQCSSNLESAASSVNHVISCYQGMAKVGQDLE
ncbi:MAG: hypothetical protein UX02_C0002G0223 [Candidatus Moranbacteria bacterium GW2011_GWC1_45_18]|nr:MAG: hypothetical protein UT79_C0001G0238 [Candidatus Moranbacteria bacterium GW2011_GWC2_40_12]KKT33397.1 MAG: hypothetical protein UW19_C0009G0043 [Candidatus Moranbacteria bacterium GW2011_GWF2_44_10]KKT72062.1 MAG: hypothetical protein UW66_C0015G0003 [Candidatus Moranbacteria bacterium GW2011_GWF1_44_4]KKT99904.1 MAG: hypothetical protein UX02_C0002G0223 [Candidatus Moranbacteria bacterium GW2011_GWC1_45_18]OGI24022.1 MAG: hypothetical protein A2194_03520 [Candidatus Moranbacteria bacte